MVIQTNTESWNGTNWTEVNDLNTGKRTCLGLVQVHQHLL